MQFKQTNKNAGSVNNMDLASVPTGTLEAEIDHRKKEEKAKREADRKEREIRVQCPVCDGVGQVRCGDTMRVSAGECNE